MSDDLSIPNPGYRGNRAGRYGTGQSRGRQGLDPDTRRLVMFAGGLGAVLVVLIGASALMGHRSTGIPVVAADTNPIRIKPENPGGMKIDAAENDVFSGGSDTSNARLAPPAESPDTKAFRAAADPQPPVAEPAATAPVAPAAVAPPPPPAVVASEPTSPVTAKPPEAKPQVAAVEARLAAPSTTGHQTMVQLAALPSEEAARVEWQQLSRRMPDLLTGRQPSFSRIERDGHTFWRVRTSGFADLAQARGFCDRVRAKGGGCSVADF